MPANLTPQYLEAERRFRQATTPDEQLEALEAMMATIPKHKGTEHMRADLRRRMAKIRTDAQRSKKAAAKGPTWHHVPREGAGQVVLVGAPNAGKSQLLAGVTNANPVIAPYPFSTRTPLPGMVPYEDINIQLVDLPPIASETAEPWLFALIRQADAALLVADLADDDLLASMDAVLALASDGRVEFARDRGREGAVATLLVAAKSDAPDARVRLDLLREAYGARFEILPVSAETGEGVDRLRDELFRMLGVIRVYTKAPGRRADKSVPYVFRRGITVEEAAAVVHKDFAERLKYAKVWGSRTYDGQMVQREHVLEDGDVLELHA
ncbi:MAG TPA: TGS domain-containing protein [bacterium]|nr:TGS domain-containing protein [bacterium]